MIDRLIECYLGCWKDDVLEIRFKGGTLE